MLRTATFDVKVDGQVVGKIAPDSYFFVDRQPGSYTLKVEPPFDWTYFETDVQVAAGSTYYYAINVTERLDVEKDGGFLRIGLFHYNTVEEVDRLLAAMKEIAM